MHVTDGILPTELCLAGYGVALGASVWCGRKLESAEIPRMGILAAASFVASLIHVPVAGVSIHFGLFGLLGLVLGLRAVPVIFAVLVLQTFLFQHGGLVSLGINVVNMASGALAGYAIGRVRVVPIPLRAFLAGFAGIFLPALLLLGEFLWAGYGRSLMLLAGVYATVGAAEGAFTSLIVGFLAKARPSVIAAMRVAAPSTVVPSASIRAKEAS